MNGSSWFWHSGSRFLQLFIRRVIKKFGYLQKAYFHSKLYPKLVRRPFQVLSAWFNRRPSLQFITLSAHLCLQQDVRDAARRAGPFAAAETLLFVCCTANKPSVSGQYASGERIVFLPEMPSKFSRHWRPPGTCLVFT